MCNAVRNGGRRCPVHQHQNIATIKVASNLSGLNRYQTERMFAELRREGRDAAAPTPSQMTDHRLATTALIPDGDLREAVVENFRVAKDTNEEADGATYYAQRLLVARAKERGDALKARFQEVAEATGLTDVEVAAKYKEFYEGVDTSRGAEAPPEYNQNTRRAAVIANLPFDQASVTALEKLKTLATVERQRRVTLIPAAEGSHISQFGYNDGRLEIVFGSSPDRIIAYQNVPEGMWDRISTSDSPGRIYAREIRGNDDYMYSSADDAESDGFNVRCASCGQFRASSHSCPEREVRSQLAAAGLSATEIVAEVEAAEAELSEGSAVTEEAPEIESANIVAEPAPTPAEAAIIEVAPEPAEYVTPAAHIPAYDLHSSVSSVPVVENTDFPNYLEAENVAENQLTQHLSTVDNQRLPEKLDQELLVVASADGLERVYIVNKTNTWRVRDGSLTPELLAQVEGAPENINFIVGRDNNNEPYRVLNTYDDRIFTAASNNVYGDRPNGRGWGVTYGYKARVRGYSAEQKTFTEEEHEAELTSANAQLRTLVDSGEAVMIESTSTETRKYILDANLRQQPFIKAGNAVQFKKTIKEGKVAIMPVNMRFTNGYSANEIDDQGFHADGLRNGTQITGEVAVRKNSNGLMEVISGERKLRCNCYDYRQKYYCSHINYAQRHIANVAQQMVPVPVSRDPNAPARNRLLPGALAARADVNVIEPVDGEAYVSFGTELSGERKTEHAYNLRGRLSVPDTLRPVDPANPTEDEIIAISKYSQLSDALNSITVPKGPTSIRAAVKRSDVEMPMSASFSRYGDNGSVTGSVIFNKNTGDISELTIKTRNLKCTCADYQANYDCKHVRFTADQALAAINIGARNYVPDERLDRLVSQNYAAIQLENQVQTRINEGHSREEAREWVANRAERERIAREEREALQRATREERERMYAEQRQREAAALEEQNRPTIEASNAYRERMMARWQNVDEGYAANSKQFFDDYKDTLRRKRAGEEVIPFRTENVTDGICAPEAGARQFGVELEFDIKSGIDKATALRNIGRALHEAGLTSDSRQTHYHSARASGWQKWSFEQDCTVSGELVSPIMSDTPEHWAELKKAVDIINEHGGVASVRAGSHVHVSTASYELSTAKHAELLRSVTANDDILYRMASNPSRGKHRGTQWCAPNAIDHADDVAEDVKSGHQVLGHNLSSHGVAVNFEGTSQTSFKKSHLEFRMWDSTLDAAVIQQQIVMSAALTDYAERSVIENQGSKKPTAPRDPIHAGKQRESAALSAAGTATHTEDSFTASHQKVAEFFDKMFRRKEDRAAAVALFAVTKWQD